MLTGQAKRDYQREYMRKHRQSVRPVRPVRPIEHTKKELCEGCKVFDKHTPATHQEEVLMNDSVRTMWLCDRCNSKVSVY
jgi:hypothetical protein